MSPGATIGYNFSWLHGEAELLKFGKIILELDVRHGKVWRATVVDKRASRSLEDTKEEPKGAADGIL